MRLALIQIFLSIVNMTQRINNHSHIIQQYEEASDAENDRNMKDLGEALKKNRLTDKQQINLRRLGGAIFTGEVYDEDYGDDFKLIGKAILGGKLNGETRFLLSKVLLSDEKTAKVYLKNLIHVLKIHQIKGRLRQNNFQPPSNYFFSRRHASNRKQKSRSDDTDVAELIDLLDKVLRSNKNQTITTFLKNSFKTGVRTDDLQNKTLKLLEMALVRDNQKDDPYQRILNLFVDSVKTGKLIEINDQEILNYINHVLDPVAPLDIAKLAEIHLKNEKPAFIHSDLSAPNTVDTQESSQDLRKNSVPKNSSVNDRNENQGYSIVNNISPGKSDSITVNQNVEHGSIKTTKSTKSKKRSKTSSKYKVKFNSESHQSEDKSRKSRKKSSKKIKRSKSSTKGATKSKNKRKKTRKSNQ